MTNNQDTQITGVGNAKGLTWLGIVKEYMQGNKQVIKIFDQKISVDTTLEGSCVFGAEGIIFGSLYPELTENMYRSTYEDIDVENWAEARRYGVDLPDKPEQISFEQREESLLGVVTGFTAEFYPELVEPLGLSDIIKQTGLEVTGQPPMEVNRDYKWNDITPLFFSIIQGKLA